MVDTRLQFRRAWLGGIGEHGLLRFSLSYCVAEVGPELMVTPCLNLPSARITGASITVSSLLNVVVLIAPTSPIKKEDARGCTGSSKVAKQPLQRSWTRAEGW